MLTNSAPLRPAERLDPDDTYTIECRLFRNGTDTGLVRTDGPYRFFHFTNLISGDASLNLLARLNHVETNRIYLVNTIPGRSHFLFRLDYELRRYDGFASPGVVYTFHPLVIEFSLLNSRGLVVPLRAHRAEFPVSTTGYKPGTSAPPEPTFAQGTFDLPVEPALPLDSVNQTYRLRVTILHTNVVGEPPMLGNTVHSALHRLMHFSGNLYFGDIQTRFTSLSNDPAPGALGLGFLNTLLAVDREGGYVVGNPGHTYGDGSPLNVRLRANGDAELASGSLALKAPSPDAASLANVRLEHGPVTLSTNGALAAVTVTLPTGFGYTTGSEHLLFSAEDLWAARILRSDVVFPGVKLNQQLLPAAAFLTYQPGSVIYGAEESKPLWIGCDAMVWETGSGSFTLGANFAFVLHTRYWENRILEAAAPVTEAPTTMSCKRDNSGYYQFHEFLLTNAPTLVANDQGAAELNLNFRFKPEGSFRTFFPYDSQVAWTNGGSMRIERDLVVPGANSVLRGVAQVTVPYTTTCPGCNSAPLTNHPTLIPAGGQLFFSRDGGLVGSGTLSPPHTLAWGYIPAAGGFAQQILSFTNAVLHLPGHFLRGDQNLQPREQGASTLLLSGVAATNLDYWERPISSSYLLGLADYAGLNFRVYSNNWRQAVSRLAGRSVGPYGLSGCSKYYVRLAGVSGLHEAYPGTFPSPLDRLGYRMDFANYGVAYLGSRNVDSRVSGLLRVPYPSDFGLEFEEMTFSCVGGLLSARVAASDSTYKKLA